jgi:hypothetical protein
MNEQEKPQGRSGRWQRRDERRERAKRRMQKHGAGFAGVYANAIKRRLKLRKKSSSDGL